MEVIQLKKQNSKEILQDIKELDLFDEITEEDVELIQNNLDDQVLINPPDDLSENIIKAVMPIMEENDVKPIKKTNYNVYLFIQQIKNQMFLMNKAFYLSAVLILTTGILLNNSGYFNQLFLFSPLLALFQVFYSYRGIYHKVYDMEMACKNSIFEITLARTITILIFDICISIIVGTLSKFIGANLPFLYVVVTWFAPMILTYFVTLYFLINKNITYSLILGGITWIFYVILYNSYIIEEQINSINILNINIGISIMSILMITYLLISTQRKNCSDIS